MQGQARQQAYDRGITIFSPDGRLYQVEYAREAVRRGAPSLGVRTSDGVVLLIDKGEILSLMEEESIEKLHKADDHIGVASAGHVADGRQLIDIARQQAQVDRVRYGVPIGVETLAKAITDHIQEYTQIGGARPFGAALLIGGIEDGEPRLFETDPSGASREWQAAAIGEHHTDLLTYLEEHYQEGSSLIEGIELALRALASIRDGGLIPAEIGIATISVDEQQFTEVSVEKTTKYLTQFDILANDSNQNNQGS